MKKIFLFGAFLFWISTASIGFAHNPFTSEHGKPHTVLTSPVKSKFFVKIVFWQHQLREKMSRLIREAKSEKDITPILLLAMFAFLYGVIHSAGPGHGKAVALSYILSCRPSLSQSILFGNLVAITHGFSGIFFVLTVKFIMHASMTQSLETMTYITQIISFSLVSLIGGFIFIKSLWNGFRKSSIDEKKQLFLFSSPYVTAFSIGLVPCPGVVMVMLFAISLNLTGLGVFLGSCIAMGMAFTITMIVLLGMSGKAAALKLSNRNQRTYRILSVSIEAAAGLSVASLGLILLFANL